MIKVPVSATPANAPVRPTSCVPSEAPLLIVKVGRFSQDIPSSDGSGARRRSAEGFLAPDIPPPYREPRPSRRRDRPSCRPLSHSRRTIRNPSASRSTRDGARCGLAQRFVLPTPTSRIAQCAAAQALANFASMLSRPLMVSGAVHRLARTTGLGKCRPAAVPGSRDTSSNRQRLVASGNGLCHGQEIQEC